MSHVEGSMSYMKNGEDHQDMDNTPHVEDRHEGSIQLERSDAAARQRRRIAQLEEKLEALESGRAAKER
jgi:hypothetical protein